MLRDKQIPPQLTEKYPTQQIITAGEDAVGVLLRLVLCFGR